MFSPIARRVLFGALFFALTIPAFAVGPAFAAGPASTAVTVADARLVRTVIEAQLAAFAKDDAKRAFAYAAPNIRDMFGSPEKFMDMVRAGYPVVYRPALVAFLKPERVGPHLIQRVQLTDQSGVLWSATYMMERQKDKSWRIGGCTVVENEGHFT